MKTRRFDGSDVRKIITGIIKDTAVCSRIAAQWGPEGLFDASWANAVGSMAINHYRKFGQAPNGHMPAIFEDWAKSTLAGDETVNSIEKFLRATSDENYDFSSEYIIDLAGKYFNKVRMEQEITSAKKELEHWRVDDAQTRLEKLRKVNLGIGAYSEPGKDVDVWLRAQNTDRVRPLFTYRGDLGEFIGDAFQRGRFFSFMAQDKSGKTTWMVDLVYRACRAKNKVAFFDVGDTSEEEFQTKLASRTLGLPEFACHCNRPVGWDEKGELEFVEEDLGACDPLQAYLEFRRVSKGDNALRSCFYPSSSFSADDLDSVLEEWDRDNWQPDVVVVDYADILAPPRGYKDTLDQIDATWKCLRRISQKRHCLLITATQASAANYGKEGYLLGKKDFSGRKTKMAHVSGMIGINVSDADREKATCRINKFAWRHRKHSEREYVKVAGCYEIERPALVSKR